jgi:hypothetical protein
MLEVLGPRALEITTTVLAMYVQRAHRVILYALRPTISNRWYS